MRKIAITGGLASGKSTVCALMKEMGAYVLDADSIVHDLLNNRVDLQEKVIHLLGKEVVKSSSLDREKIAQKVFKDPLLLSHLETILHPEVRLIIKKKWTEVSMDPQWKAFVVEVPLLFETEPDHGFDVTIVIQADEALCFKRFHSKTKKNKEDFDLRMHRQMPPKLKARKADFVLYNDGNLKNLKESTERLFSQIT